MGEEDKAQNACKHLVVISLSGANKVFCRTVLILLIPYSCLFAWIFSTPSSISSHFSGLHILIYKTCSSLWVQDPDSKKHLVRSWDLDRLLSKQGTVQVPLQRTSLHCLGHSLRATLPPPQREEWRRGDSVQLNSALCDDGSPSVQINVTTSKVFQSIAFIIQIHILSNLTC